MHWITGALLLYIVQMITIVLIEFRRPQKAVTWLVILFMLPFVGFLPYLFVAKEYACKVPVPRKENEQLDKIKKHLVNRCKQRLTDEEMLEQTAFVDLRLQAMLLSLPLPPSAGNQTNIYAHGKQAFEAMLEAMSSAQHHIHIEFFIIRNDQLGKRLQQLLMSKAREGVQVRLLYDGVGCRRLPKDFVKQLQTAGVETGCFFPMLDAILRQRINYRNHRKIVVVDGRVGFIGGLNIGDEYLGKDAKFGFWRDTHYCIRGDAVLWIQYTFLTDWFHVRGEALTDPAYYPDQGPQGKELVQIVKSGPDETILELIFSLIASAKKRIYIETPYFIPDPGILLALKTAVSGGVDVRIIIPDVPDHSFVYHATLSFVEELLPAGVRFFCYKRGFLHSKVIIADDLACSGSANMDIRSFCGQFEINAVFWDGKIVNNLMQDFNSDLQESKEILWPEFEQRSKMQKVKEAFSRLLSPLF